MPADVLLSLRKKQETSITQSKQPWDKWVRMRCWKQQTSITQGKQPWVKWMEEGCWKQQTLGKESKHFTKKWGEVRCWHVVELAKVRASECNENLFSYCRMQPNLWKK